MDVLAFGVFFFLSVYGKILRERKLSNRFRFSFGVEYYPCLKAINMDVLFFLSFFFSFEETNSCY